MPTSHTVNPDQPTLADELTWVKDIDLLLERICNCPTPHVLGIHGDWGAGKTSLMRQIQHQLGGVAPNDGSVCMQNTPARRCQTNLPTVWFDAWRYQNEAVPIVALLAEIRQQFGKMAKLAASGGKFADITARVVLDSIANLGKSIGVEALPSAEKIEKLGESWEKRHFAETSMTTSIRRHLEEAISVLLQDENSRLVIFIDDLDRCNPKSAVKLLEQLKVYLSIKQCVFILGMNERMLIGAIQEEVVAPHGVSPDQKRLHAAHYFEKICTDVHRIPLTFNPNELLVKWLQDPQHSNALQQAIVAVPQVCCIPPNPRRIKALANQWPRFAARLAWPDDPAQQKVWAAKVLIAVYIYQLHRDIWERWQFQPDFWLEIGQFSTHGFTEVNMPSWGKGLSLTHANTSSGSTTNFPNPGDIENFWIGTLVAQHSTIASRDFTELLSNQ